LFAIEEPDVQRLQELAHAEDYDYLAGSPHLKHQSLHNRLVTQLRTAIVEVSSNGHAPAVLEVGAGDGAFVAAALDAGASVTATEMSRPAIAILERRFGADPAFSAIFVDDDTPPPYLDARYSVVLFASVLHHIPDYLDTVDRVLTYHLEPGGTFLSFQDPLWYPAQSRTTRLFNQVAYLSWRLRQGNLRRGIQARLRRMRGAYDDHNVSDTAEYHVVRQGVDHHRLIATLTPRFERVELVSYWSTQSDFWQRLGEKSGRANTFAIVARGYRV
jgi:SAM-dependent methyltransferase